MLSDERISLAERLDRYAGSLDHELQGDLCGLMYDAADAIRAALAEAAQVPVMKSVTKELSAFAWSRAYCEGDEHGDFNLRIARHVADLIKPPTSITQAELDAKDARIRELEEVLVQFITYAKSCNDDSQELATADAAIAKENGK